MMGAIALYLAILAGVIGFAFAGYFTIRHQSSSAFDLAMVFWAISAAGVYVLVMMVWDEIKGMRNGMQDL